MTIYHFKIKYTMPKEKKEYTVKLTNSQIELIKGALIFGKMFSKNDLIKSECTDIITRLKNNKK